MHKIEDFKTEEGYNKYINSLRQTQNGWNIADRNKPKSGDLVMIYTPENTIQKSNILMGTYWDDTEDWTVYDFERTKELIVTHWKAIPQPPY